MLSSFKIEIEKIGYWDWGGLIIVPDIITCKFIFKGYKFYHEQERWVDCDDILIPFGYIIENIDSKEISEGMLRDLSVTSYDKNNVKIHFFSNPNPYQSPQIEKLIYAFITIIPIEEYTSAIIDFYNELIRRMDEKGIGPPEEREKFIKEYEPIFQKYEEWKKKRDEVQKEKS